MKRGISWTGTLVATLAVLGSGAGAYSPDTAKPPSVPVGITAALPSIPGAFEVDVGYSPFDDRRTGEPSLAVNPADPNNIIIGITASTQTNRNPERTLPMVTSIPFNLLCGVAVSFDRGRTWRVSELHIPIGPIPTTKTPMPEGAVCFDTSVAAGPDGTLYGTSVVSSPYNYGGARAGHSKDREIMGLWRSDDKGRTWTLHEGMGEGAGKPWIAVDQSTGTLYLVNSGANLAVSRDRGTSFTQLKKAFAVPGAQAAGVASYGIMLSAARGEVAVVHIVDHFPKAQACPCAVFSISEDQGKTFRHHLVPTPDGIGQMQTAPALPWVTVAGDPTRKGRFAVALDNKAQTEMQVWITQDSGASWTGPVRLGREPAGTVVNRIWLDYSPRGVLAAMWRVSYTRETSFRPNQFTQPALRFIDSFPGPQDVFAAIASGGDTNFTAALKVNAQRSPEYPMTTPWSAGDDYSALAVDREAAHVSWGDYRDGDRSVWYAQVPLTAFKGSSGSEKR
jgi:hypothetical protein